MAQNRTLEKQISNITDDILYSRLYRLFKVLEQVGLERAREILERIGDDPREFISLDDLPDEEKQILMPIIQELNLLETFKELLPQRREPIYRRFHGTVYGRF